MIEYEALINSEDFKTLTPREKEKVVLGYYKDYVLPQMGNYSQADKGKVLLGMMRDAGLQEIEETSPFLETVKETARQFLPTVAKLGGDIGEKVYRSITGKEIELTPHAEKYLKQREETGAVTLQDPTALFHGMLSGATIGLAGSKKPERLPERIAYTGGKWAGEVLPIGKAFEVADSLVRLGAVKLTPSAKAFVESTIAGLLYNMAKGRIEGKDDWQILKDMGMEGLTWGLMGAALTKMTEAIGEGASRIKSYVINSLSKEKKIPETKVEGTLKKIEQEIPKEKEEVGFELIHKDIAEEAKAVKPHERPFVSIPKEKLSLGYVGQVLSFPETVARKFERIPEVKEIVKGNLEDRIHMIGQGAWEARKFENIIKKVPRPDLERAIQVYNKASITQQLPEEYNSLSASGKKIFDAMKRMALKMRKTYIDHVKDLLKESVKSRRNLSEETKLKYLEAIDELDAEGVTDESLKERIRELKEIGKYIYYRPQVRKGDFYIHITTPKGQPLFTRTFEDEKTYLQALEALKRGDYKIVENWFNEIGLSLPKEWKAFLENKAYHLKYGPTSILPVEAISEVSAIKTRALLKNILEKTDKITDEQKTEILDALVDDYLKWARQAGFGKHFIGRERSLPGGVPGFETDPEKTMEEFVGYIRGLYASIGKQEYLKKAITNFSKLTTTKEYVVDKDLIKYLSDYIDYTTGTPEAWNTAANAISQWVLWFNLASAFRNATQNFTSGAAAYIHNKIPLSNLVKAMKDFTGGKLSITDKKALTKLLKTGEANAFILQEMAGNKLAFGVAGEVGLLPHQLVEVYVNRIPSFLGAFRHFYSKSNNLDNAFEKALAIMREGHYLASRFNRPPIARGNIQRVLSALQTFTMHWFKQLKHYYDERDLKALAYLFGSQTALGGLKYGLPFGTLSYAIIKKAYEEATGRDLDFKIEELPPIPKELLKHGMLGVAGVPGLAFGIGPGADDPTRAFVAVTLAKQFMKALDLAQQGLGKEALELILPTGIRNVLRAVRESTKGVTTTSGTPVLEAGKEEQIKLTPSEAIQRAMGITPGRLVESYELKGIIRDYLLERERNLTYFRNRLLKAESWDDAKAVMEELNQYNKNIMERIEKTDNPQEKAALYMLLIDSKDLSRSAKSKIRAFLPGGKKGQAIWQLNK